MPTVSIIIPVYNASLTLSRCVASVMAQSFDDWEMLLVDDGSVDESLSICRTLMEADSRIRVFSQPHAGVSQARNRALAEMEGQYVCFIDADDYVETDYLASFLADEEFDFAVCGYYVDWYDGIGKLAHRKAYLPVELRLSTYTQRDALLPLFLSGMIHINCNKMIRADLIRQHHIRYEAVPINEDYLFMLDCLNVCERLRTIRKPLYHWIRHDGVQSGLSAFPDDIVRIYNEAHDRTARFFGSPLVAGRVMYDSYYFLVLKYLDRIEEGRIVYGALRTLLANPLLSSSFAIYRPASKSEALLLFLLRHRCVRIFHCLHKYLNHQK